MKVGIIDVGGGLRDVFGTGVFDYLIDNNIFIDQIVGISAGSGNAVTYMSKQSRRNYKSYMEFSKRKEYMSLSNYIKDKNYVGLKYIYDDLTKENGELPFDFNTYKKSKTKLIVVATNAETGEAEYFTNKDIQKNNYGVCSASSTLPVLNEPYEFNGSLYYDGSISDPIPIEKCYEYGCDKIIIILTRPVEYRKKDGKKKLLYSSLKKKYGKFYEKLNKRCETYNDKLDEIIKNYMPKGNILIVAPKSTKGISTLTKNYKKLDELYREGYDNGKIIEEFLEK